MLGSPWAIGVVWVSFCTSQPSIGIREDPPTRYTWKDGGPGGAAARAATTRRTASTSPGRAAVPTFDQVLELGAVDLYRAAAALASWGDRHGGGDGGDGGELFFDQLGFGADLHGQFAVVDVVGDQQFVVVAGRLHLFGHQPGEPQVELLAADLVGALRDAHHPQLVAVAVDHGHVDGASAEVQDGDAGG